MITVQLTASCSENLTVTFMGRPIRFGMSNVPNGWKGTEMTWGFSGVGTADSRADAIVPTVRQRVTRKGATNTVHSYSMRVRVCLRREHGKPRPPYGQRVTASGDLHLTYVTANGHKVQALQLLGADRDCPRLFEPRLVALSAKMLRFVGFEREEDAWVMQEWECDLM